MITAVDTSVLLDVFTADATYLDMSRGALRRCAAEGRLVACDVVWAELAAQFGSLDEMTEALRAIDVEFSSMGREASLLAGRAWVEYRRRGGSRERIVSDFLVGAHAQKQADRLLTRDRGFYRSYFDQLEVLDPASELGTAPS